VPCAVAVCCVKFIVSCYDDTLNPGASSIVGSLHQLPHACTLGVQPVDVCRLCWSMGRSDRSSRSGGGCKPIGYLLVDCSKEVLT
jgi:hypothetical protein